MRRVVTDAFLLAFKRIAVCRSSTGNDAFFTLVIYCPVTPTPTPPPLSCLTLLRLNSFEVLFTETTVPLNGKSPGKRVLVVVVVVKGVVLKA